MNVPPISFYEWPKIARLSRQIIVTEKIDGSNAQIYIPDPDAPDAGEIYAGSRSHWITPQNDNMGFAAWVEDNQDELAELGPGHHFGEWWGRGIQRNYGVANKRFSLFNTTRWGPADNAKLPICCGVVPVLWQGEMDQFFIPNESHFSPYTNVLNHLKTFGSVVAPGFMRPEGVVIFHTASGHMYKKTLEKDEQPKSVRR